MRRIILATVFAALTASGLVPAQQGGTMTPEQMEHRRELEGELQSLAVVNRKVSGGNRSERGAETQEILSSVVQTSRLRDLDPRDVLVDLLRSPQPTVSPALSTLQ